MNAESFAKLFVGAEIYIDTNSHKRVEIQTGDHSLVFYITPFEYGDESIVGYKVMKVSYLTDPDDGEMEEYKDLE